MTEKGNSVFVTGRVEKSHIHSPAGRMVYPMKLWIVNHYAIPPTQAGGTRHYTFARELVRLGHEVTLIASSFDHTTRRELHLHRGELYKFEESGGVRFLWLRTPPYAGNTPARVRNMIAFANHVWRKVPRILGRPDVILGSSPHLFAALAAERLAAHYRVPFVLEVRDLWPQTLIDLGHLARYHPLVVMLESIERYLYRRARRIVTVLPGASGYMQGKGADPGKVIWIPNGIDLNLVGSPRPPRQSGVVTAMYAGAHGLANSLDLVLEAAYLLQQDGWADRVRFRLVGDGPEKPALIRKASQLGLVNVHFQDAVPKHDVYGLLAEADVFLVVIHNSPLYRWGISLNKLFDYMGSARPVIFCGSAPFNPIQEARAGIIVPPGDAIRLAEAIRKVAEMSPEERWEMGLRGRQYVEKHHSLNHLASKLEETLRAVVEEAMHAEVGGS